MGIRGLTTFVNQSCSGKLRQVDLRVESRKLEIEGKGRRLKIIIDGVYFLVSVYNDHLIVLFLIVNPSRPFTFLAFIALILPGSLTRLCFPPIAPPPTTTTPTPLADGLQNFLYSSSRLDKAAGGEYVAFERHCMEFFAPFLLLPVDLFVVYDGVLDPLKVNERMIRQAKQRSQLKETMRFMFPSASKQKRLSATSDDRIQTQPFLQDTLKLPLMAAATMASVLRSLSTEEDDADLNSILTSEKEQRRGQNYLDTFPGKDALNSVELDAVESKFASSEVSPPIQDVPCEKYRDSQRGQRSLLPRSQRGRVRLLRSHGENDEFVAALSIKIGAYAVLGNDSDFFILPCTGYMPLNSLTVGRDGSVCGLLYHRYILAKTLHIHECLLPHFACLMGNDSLHSELADFHTWLKGQQPARQKNTPKTWLIAKFMQRMLHSRSLGGQSLSKRVFPHAKNRHENVERFQKAVRKYDVTEVLSRMEHTSADDRMFFPTPEACVQLNSVELLRRHESQTLADFCLAVAYQRKLWLRVSIASVRYGFDLSPTFVDMRRRVYGLLVASEISSNAVLDVTLSPSPLEAVRVDEYRTRLVCPRDEAMAAVQGSTSGAVGKNNNRKGSRKVYKAVADNEQMHPIFLRQLVVPVVNGDAVKSGALVGLDHIHEKLSLDHKTSVFLSTLGLDAYHVNISGMLAALPCSPLVDSIFTRGQCLRFGALFLVTMKWIESLVDHAPSELVSPLWLPFGKTQSKSGTPAYVRALLSQACILFALREEEMMTTAEPTVTSPPPSVGAADNQPTSWEQVKDCLRHPFMCDSPISFSETSILPAVLFQEAFRWIAAVSDIVFGHHVQLISPACLFSASLFNRQYDILSRAARSNTFVPDDVLCAHSATATVLFSFVSSYCLTSPQANRYGLSALPHSLHWDESDVFLPVEVDTPLSSTVKDQTPVNNITVPDTEEKKVADGVDSVSSLLSVVSLDGVEVNDEAAVMNPVDGVDSMTSVHDVPGIFLLCDDKDCKAGCGKFMKIPDKEPSPSPPPRGANNKPKQGSTAATSSKKKKKRKGKKKK